MKKLVKRTFKLANSLHTPGWLILILALALFLRIPSFFEPYSYGDETIYLTLGEGVRQGKALYTEVYDNKPPLLYLTAALAGNLFWFKAILAFWSFATIVFFWKLVEYLFPKRYRLQQVATLVFALLTTLPLLEGNIANAENFMIGFSILGFYILLREEHTFKNVFVSGVFFAIAILFKVPAVFDIPAIILFWIITGGIKNLKNTIRNTFYLGLGVAAPILLTFIIAALSGSFQEYLVSSFLQNVGYLSTFRPEDATEPFLVKNGPLLVRAFLVLVASCVLYLFRNRLSKQFIFATLWLFMTLFAVTLSERPYPHYILQSTAPLSLLLAMLFALNTIEQTLVIIPLTIAICVPVYYKFWYYSTRDYYARFANFVVSDSGRDKYLSEFGGHIPRSYKIAELVMSLTTKDDGLFVWGGENQTIYALSRRFPPIKYVAQYHINDFSNQKEVAEKLLAKPPKIIVILPFSDGFPELTELIQSDYIQINEIDYAKVYLKTSVEVK